MDPNVLNHTSFQFIRLPSYHRNWEYMKEFDRRGEKIKEKKVRETSLKPVQNSTRTEIDEFKKIL